MTTQKELPHTQAMSPLEVPQVQGMGQNVYPQAVANFNLLVARERKSERAPTYFGSFKLNGEWFHVDTWVKHASSDGQPYLSNAIRPCTPAESEKHDAREASFNANSPATDAKLSKVEAQLAQAMALLEKAGIITDEPVKDVAAQDPNTDDIFDDKQFDEPSPI